MARQITASKCTLVMVCCLKLSSAFLSPHTLLDIVKHFSAAQLVQPIVREHSETNVLAALSILRGRGSQLLMSSSSDGGKTSNYKKTITVGINERYSYGKESTSESGEIIPAAPLEALVLTLTGNRVNLDWDYTVSSKGPVKVAAEQLAFKALVKPGEFAASFQLTALRLEEIAAMCLPAQPRSVVLQKSVLEASGLPIPIVLQMDEIIVTGSGIISSTISAPVIKNQNLSPERKVTIKKMEIAANLLKNGPDKMLLEQALSLRKQMLVDKIVNNGWRMKNLALKIRTAYEKGSTLSELCELKVLVKQGLRGDGAAWDELMNDRDKTELAGAKAVDNMSYVEEDNSERIISTAWEDSLYTYLDSQNIAYVHEQTLKDAGSKSTPDCVLLDDCYINGKLVRWIDMKCFYGTSCSRHFIEKLKKQAKRYDEEFDGPGAIIYKLGYSESLPGKLPETLFLDRGPLSSVDPFLTSDNVLADE